VKEFVTEDKLEVITDYYYWEQSTISDYEEDNQAGDGVRTSRLLER